MLKLIAATISSLFLLASPLSTSAQSVLRLATTTSTENSGLLGAILPEFEAAHDVDVQIISVGTGKALRLGENGDVDVVMVHAKTAEEAFVDSGFGVSREPFMFNYFLIVGPEHDPAKLDGAASAVDAFRRLHSAQSLFISRGDDSGTHMRELSIWREADLSPQGVWYREAGQGMGKVLQIAGELRAYTVTDRGTWLKLREGSGLAPLYSSSPPLYNPYSVIAVSPTRHPHVNTAAAGALVDWLKSEPAQSLIDRYRINGERAFTPLYLD
ncbi:MAG: substrate-binding domain-containing protein [Pseudomonadota bacterium]